MSSMAAQSDHRSQMTNMDHESVMAPEPEIEFNIQDKLQKKIGNLFANFGAHGGGTSGAGGPLAGLFNKPEQSPMEFTD